MKKTSRPAIETISDFRCEFTQLLENIESNITSLARYERSEMVEPNISLVEKLNSLKNHRKKLKDMLKFYSGADHAAWELIRPKARETFEAAREEYLRVSRTLAST